MHIVIGLLTAIAGFFWALSHLQNSGAIDSLNPFLWYRRAQWRKKLGTKPLYTLQKPMEAAAVLILGMAKCEGEISKEQKQAILQIFENEFRLSANEAQGLFRSSAFLLKDEVSVINNVDKILEPSKEKFTREQIDSLLAMLHKVSEIDGAANQQQLAMIENTGNVFSALQRKR